jgi:hypothetical protein
MIQTPQEIRAIPIKDICILNPRVRAKKVFNELVKSIANLGLKKPITVSVRPDGSGYDLGVRAGTTRSICGIGPGGNSRDRGKRLGRRMLRHELGREPCSPKPFFA